ncbi:MAG: type I 3-dehydroquinate dehydratase, partial [archaeon]|nr:type I 3-dehydroquinate dehydratase [archaeon]
EKEQELGDIAKVAFMPQDLEDTLKILTILSHFDDVIAISMGELGTYTRVMTSKFNSPITFAVGRDVTAPGQIDIETMRCLLNMDLEIESLFKKRKNKA